MHRPASSRHLFHLATGLILALLVFWLGREKAGILIGSLLLITILMETLRLRMNAFNQVLVGLFGSMLKERETQHPTGVGYFLGGILICLLFFHPEVALASIVILSVGDPAASVIGQRWGRTRIGEKSLEGAAAFWVCAMAAGMLFQGFWPGLSFVTFSIGVLTGAVVECLPLRIDDNFLLPITTGLSMEILMKFLI
jgi:dolichol kinase